jgi:hypothetical protein
MRCDSLLDHFIEPRKPVEVDEKLAVLEALLN